jgi:hypothetical protein
MIMPGFTADASLRSSTVLARSVSGFLRGCVLWCASQPCECTSPDIDACRDRCEAEFENCAQVCLLFDVFKL